jgi:prepilin-type N-terminal cleavage/methylation domain-containing protein
MILGLNLNNKAFTLIEMSITLVIIGLIIGGVLKGDELIEATKLKRFESQVSRVQVGYLQYFDRFNRPPGDRDGDGEINYKGQNEKEMVAFFNDLLSTKILSSAQACPECETNTALAKAGRPYLTTPMANGNIKGFRPTYYGKDYGFWLRVSSSGDDSHGVMEDKWLSRYDNKVDDGDIDNGFVQLLRDGSTDNETHDCADGKGYTAEGNKCVFLVQPNYDVYVTD